LLWVSLAAFRPRESIHAADLLARDPATIDRSGPRNVLWHLAGRPRFWVVFFLFCWSYFELTAAAILAPAGMATLPVRLYNLTHYGQTPTLSVMICAAFLVPVFVVGLVRWIAPRIWTAATRKLNQHV